MRHHRHAWVFVLAGAAAGLATLNTNGGRSLVGSPRLGAAEMQAGGDRPEAIGRPALKTFTGTFDGVIGRTVEESRASWPAPLRARPGSPNVAYIVLDDVGFSQLVCFGGPVSTPNVERLAGYGLRYNNFHTTALCSPTRACLLTGRNHHSNHMACITEGSTGFPGSDGQIPKENGLLSEVLVRSGYSAFAVGKWHLTPDEETNMAARKDRWPLGRGFERFYGFMGGETHQYYPELIFDNHPVEPPATPEQGYHLTADLTDRAIGFVRDQKAVAPDKPFFLYYATGAAHAPHQAPREWIENYRGKFDQGWDRLREETLARQKAMGVVPAQTDLPPRNAEVKPWDFYGAEERRLFSRFMEVFAGFLAHADDQIGRLITYLEGTSQLDNTLFFVVSDNGASAEGGEIGSFNENIFFNALPESLEANLKMIDELGGPDTYNHYPFGWTMAGNTPFKKWKRKTHLGGVRDPLIVHCPKGIRAKGEVRTQYAHAIDLVPTALDVCGLAPPAAIDGVTQSPTEGVSFVHTFNQADAKSRHETQYFEMFGYRALYHLGWTAVSPYLPFGTPLTEALLDAKSWELYHNDEDFSQSNDLAERSTANVHDMNRRLWVEAGKHHVLPFDGRGQQRLADPRPQLTPGRDHYDYYPGAQVPQTVAVRVIGRSHRITAGVETPPSGAEGVLLAQGSLFGGFAFFVKGKKLHYTHNYVGLDQSTISSVEDIGPGKATLRFDLTLVGPHQGKGTLYVNGRQVGEGTIPKLVPLSFGLQGPLTCGYGSAPAVSDTFKAPFRFSGTLSKVTVDLE